MCPESGRNQKMTHWESDIASSIITNNDIMLVVFHFVYEKVIIIWLKNIGLRYLDIRRKQKLYIPVQNY